MKPDETLIIGDIGGEFEALMQLTKCHQGKIVLVGDLNDRGARSREVIEWAMRNEDRVITLESNHGHMFWNYVDDFGPYEPSDFTNNGGLQTLISYGYKPDPENPRAYISDLVAFVKTNVPVKHLEFLRTCPAFVELEDAIVSHAPAYLERYLEESQLHEYDLFKWIWNRYNPVELKSRKWQIFGHNSHWGLKVNEDDKWICLDDSRKGLLTGMYWPSRVIVQERFREEEA